jgi:hypothetical protein
VTPLMIWSLLRKLDLTTSSSSQVDILWWLISHCCCYTVIPSPGISHVSTYHYIFYYLVGGTPIPLWKLWKSVGIILINIWNISQWEGLSQYMESHKFHVPSTTNQITIYIRYHLHYGFLDGLFWKNPTNGILDSSHLLVLHGYPIGWIRGRSPWPLCCSRLSHHPLCL